MVISPQIVMFLVFMLIVVQATRLDEVRQRKREATLRKATEPDRRLAPMAAHRH